MRLVWLVVEIHKGFKMNWEISVNIEEVGGRERDKLESSFSCPEPELLGKVVQHFHSTDTSKGKIFEISNSK